MDVITMAMCKPKVIDLDKYEISPIIESLVAEGGGEYESGYADSIRLPLWSELKEGKTHVVCLTAMGLRITANNVIVVKAYNVTLDIETMSLMFELPAAFGGLPTRITVMIGESCSLVDGEKLFGLNMTVAVREI